MPRASIDSGLHHELKKTQRPRVIDDLALYKRASPKRPNARGLFHESFLEMVYKLSLLGLNDDEIGMVFEVDNNTIQKWRNDNPEFKDAYEAGRKVADANVAASLYRRANGYSHPAEKFFYNKDTGAVTRVEYMQHYPPDTAAAALWLRNRDRLRWGLGVREFEQRDTGLQPPTIIFNPVNNVSVDRDNRPEPATIDVEAA